MGKRVYQLRRIIAVIAVSTIFCVGCGNKSAEMQPETNLQEEMSEEPQGTEGQEEDLTESIPESGVEADAESAQTALDDEKEAEENLGLRLEMQSFPKPWGELIEGKAPVVSIMTENREWYAQDGETVLYVAYQDTVTVENEGFDNLQAALAEYFSPIDEKEHETFRRYAQEAYDDFDEEKENYFINYYSWQRVELERSDSTVISFDESCSIHTGGVHPYGGCLGVTFDVKTGRKLELADILKDEAGFYEAAVDYLTDWLVRNFGEKSFGQEKRNYVARTFDEDRTVNWYLNGAGIVIIYNPEEIADHASGVIEITLSYGLFYEYIREEYTNPHTELIVRIPENEDIAGLLGETSRIAVEKEDVFGSEARIVTDKSSEVVGEFVFLRNIFAIKRQDGRSFILVVGDYASDDNELFVYEVTGGNIRKCDALSGADLTGNRISTDKVEVSLVLYELGTYTATMEYMLSEEGELICPEQIIPIESDWSMTVIKELPVTIDGTETVIGIGNQIIITGTNNKDTVYFKSVESGQQGEIHYEMDTEEPWIHLIGGVSEFEYFEAIPYAG